MPTGPAEGVALMIAEMQEVAAFLSRVDGTPFVLHGSYAKVDGLIVASNAILGNKVAGWLAETRLDSLSTAEH